MAEFKQPWNDADVDDSVAKLRAGLGAKKGDLWLRKIVFLTGIKACISGIKTSKTADAADEYVDTLSRLVSSDVMADMLVARPERTAKELCAELVVDCQDMVNNMTDAINALLKKKA